MNQSQYELVLRRCGYWITLLGHPASSNKRTVRVHIPRRQVFDVNALKGLMGRVANGEKP